MTPAPIQAASAGIKSVAILHMMSQFGLGGSRWAKQFIYGFGVMGTSPHAGLYSPDGKTATPESPDRFFPDASSRFATRAKASGWLHADTLWTEATEKVEKGWMGPPRKLVSPIGYLWLGAGRVNAAFRFDAIQMCRIRASDDLKYGCANEACAARTPISFPTRGHIGEICLDISTTDRPWAFSKVGQKAAYKNLPLNPEQADACIATLRNPSDGLFYGFRPRAFLFGAVAAALRYNFFSRIIAALANLTIGIPTANYFDDIGPMSKSPISEEALATFSDFSEFRPSF